MRIDLARSGEGSLTLEADICIIGGGAAGCLLARLVANRGRRVVVVEAGPPVCVSPDELGFEASFAGSCYAGATRGRFFGVGGSTSRWGGLLAPVTDLDTLEGEAGEIEAVADAWKHIVTVVSRQSSAVLQTLGWKHGDGVFARYGMRLSPSARAAFEKPFITQSSLYLPFRLKNLAWLLPVRDSGRGGCRVLYNAVASSWQCVPGAHGAARITSVTAVSSNGRRATVNAAYFVIAAGAIESTRILHELNDAAVPSIVPQTAALGSYLGDHLSIPIADVHDRDLAMVVRSAAPRFTGAWMQGARILERHRPPGAARAFTHYIFENTSPGFMLAKELLQSLQQGRVPRIGLRDGARGLAGLVGLVQCRLISSRLHIPKDTPIHLQLDIEQSRVFANRVWLSDERDSYGRRKLSIDWAIRSVDERQIASTASRILAKWPRGPGVPRLLPRDLEFAGLKPHDAYHPVGTCRMGSDPEAVVSHDLRVRGTANAWVTSTAVLPTASTANPTFSLLCLTHDLASRLS